MGKHVCCITTSLLGVDVDFATQVAILTRPNMCIIKEAYWLALVPKCLGSKVSWVRSVYCLDTTPHYRSTRVQRYMTHNSFTKNTIYNDQSLIVEINTIFNNHDFQANDNDLSHNNSTFALLNTQPSPTL